MVSKSLSARQLYGLYSTIWLSLRCYYYFYIIENGDLKFLRWVLRRRRLLQCAGNERNYGGHKSSFIDEGSAECFSADAIKSSGLDIN